MFGGCGGGVGLGGDGFFVVGFCVDIFGVLVSGGLVDDVFLVLGEFGCYGGGFGFGYVGVDCLGIFWDFYWRY